MDFETCLKENKTKKTIKDKNLIKSCLNMSEKRLKAIKHIPNNEDNAAIIASNAYESLLEVCNALLNKKEYKSYSHECITYFLKEKLEENEISEIFDRNRKLRNGINYYGTSISPERAEQALKEIKQVIKNIKNKYFK